MPKIKAAVAHAFGHSLTVQEVILEAPKADEVEVTLEACAICHSDIMYLDGEWGGSLPAVYGHEAAGRISARPRSNQHPLDRATATTLTRLGWRSWRMTRL